jgi:hypothetical protein
MMRFCTQLFAHFFLDIGELKFWNFILYKMAENEERNEKPSRGNDWEVVSLTASAYAAAPGPKHTESNEDDNDESAQVNKGETSQAMFMSGHFLFPPSQHENLRLESKNTETDILSDEGGRSGAKDDEEWNVKSLTESVELYGIQEFGEKGNVGDRDYEGGYYDGPVVLDEAVEHNDEDLDSSDVLSGLAKNVDDDDDVSDVPKFPKSEAWWKKRAASLYAHAKEANTFWSIFIAAAVMGLVIIGQQWQQDRWHVLQLKFNDERMGRMMSPLSRFKDAIVGGTRRGSLIRGSPTQL